MIKLSPKRNRLRPRINHAELLELFTLSEYSRPLGSRRRPALDFDGAIEMDEECGEPVSLKNARRLDLSRERTVRYQLWNVPLRGVLTSTIFAVSLSVLLPATFAQSRSIVSSHHTRSFPPPSNKLLADPALEARVDRLLQQMTLEEKIGQLVQYNDTGNTTTGSKPGGIAAINPEPDSPVDAMQLAATGGVGSMLNTVGKDRTNLYQHLAVDKSRLHIPLLFGADVIHGFRTIYPVPLGLAATFDPDLVVDLAHTSAEEATTAGVTYPKWYNENYWGITSSMSVSGYQAWGGPPAQGAIDGTVVPCAAAGSLVFLPNECLQVLEALYASWKATPAWGRYGFVDAFNANVSPTWFNPTCLGINLGITVLMIENLRSGQVWNTFMSNPECAQAMQSAGFKS